VITQNLTLVEALLNGIDIPSMYKTPKKYTLRYTCKKEMSFMTGINI
jgi:hypothetical protein